MRKESHRRIAIHEAGHAVVNHDLGARVNAVEIQISGRLSGNCWATFPAFFGLEERTASYFAGMHAELCFGFEHEPLALRESLSWHDLEALRLMYDREVELYPDRAEEVSRRMAAADCRAREIIGGGARMSIGSRKSCSARARSTARRSSASWLRARWRHDGNRSTRHCRRPGSRR